MAVTRDSVDVILIRRLGSLLAEAGLDGETTDGNQSLSDPIGWALRMLGFSPASLTTVDDSDLVAISGVYVDALLDLAELRTLESISGHLTSVGITVGPVSQQSGELATRVIAMARQKRSDVAAQWGAYLSAPLTESSTSTVRLRSL